MRTISETAYKKKYQEDPAGVKTWVFLFFKNDELSGKFSAIGEYKDCKKGAIRFLKMGGHEEGQVRL